VNEDLERALARRLDAARRFDAADPDDRLAVDAAIMDLCTADLELRRVLLRLRKGAA
jgi:hypothetical protein